VTEQVRTIPVGRRELWAWCLYDFANSSFTTLIVTVAYSVYFVQVVARDLGQDGTAERVWFWGYAISMLIVALLSPSLGALADARAAKRTGLIASTLVCVACTALLFFVQAGDVWLGLLLFAGANIAFDLGFMFCSAFLVELAPPEAMGRISGYGWGLGYAGGLLSLAIAYPLINGGFTEATCRCTEAVSSSRPASSCSPPSPLFCGCRSGRSRSHGRACPSGGTPSDDWRKPPADSANTGTFPPT